MTTAFDFSAERLSGAVQPLSDFRGHALLIVNVASKCGFTPQYAGLQALHDRLHPEGFEVLGFPCNQFGAQEPGSAEEIETFCRATYGVDFPMFAKVEVNGPGAHPLYHWLTETIGGENGKDIEWNFAKFLIDRDGTLLQRYSPQTTPDALTDDIESALAG